MIQELRTLLLNEPEGRQFLLVPTGFSSIPLSQVESSIRGAILGGQSGSLEYRCFVADKLFSAIYRDSEFSGILADAFDTRVYLSPDVFVDILQPEYVMLSGSDSTMVSVAHSPINKSKLKWNYSFSKDLSDLSGKTVLISGSDGYSQGVVLTDDELLYGSSWKKINDSGIFVKFSFGESTVPALYDAEVDVSLPFVFDAHSVLESLLSIQGLIDFMYLIGSEYPEILQKFNSDGRKDRKLFSIIVAYGISTKKKSK